MEDLSPEVLHEAVKRVRVSPHESSCEIDFHFPFQWSVPLPIVTGFQLSQGECASVGRDSDARLSQ
jgi:hypothetical protein